MPSPLGHALASAVIYKCRNRNPWLSDWKKLFFCVFTGISPDLDFIPGFLLGNKEMFHHHFSHSFLGALIIAVFFWIIYGLWRRTWKRGDFFLFAAILMIHSVMDVLSLDTSSPYGCPLFYPWIKDFWNSPWVFFEDIHRASLRDFLLGSNNLLAFWIELLVFSPFIVYMTFFQTNPRRIWYFTLASLASFGVMMYYLHVSVITPSGIEFIRVFGLE